MQLRYYQNEAIEAVKDYLTTKEGSPLIELPTGSGKSLVIAELNKQLIAAYSNFRILNLTHRKELIQQNYSQLKALWPAAPAGIFSASLNKKELDKSITIAGIDSIYNKALELGKIHIIIIDEAHRVPSKQGGRYRHLIDACKKINPNLYIIGLTATPYRLSGGLLTDPYNKKRIFTDICYTACITDLIEKKYLCELKTPKVENSINTSKVSMIGADFNIKELETAALMTNVTELAVEEILSQTVHYKKVLVFVVSLKQADRLLELMPPSASIVTGKHSKREREQRLKDFTEGSIKYLINCDILTTGFDCPDIDCIVLMRPTASPGLYVQMVGRGLRISPHKDHCLILDFGENIDRHGPINNIQAPTPSIDKQTKNKMAQPLCPSCLADVEKGWTRCPVCGFEKPTNPKHTEEASTASILGSDKEEIYKVDSISYHQHDWAAVPSMRIECVCGNRTFKDYIHIGAQDNLGRRTYYWWKKNGVNKCPATISEAIKTMTPQMPRAIKIKKKGKYTNIVRYWWI